MNKRISAFDPPLFCLLACLLILALLVNLVYNASDSFIVLELLHVWTICLIAPQVSILVAQCVNITFYMIFKRSLNLKSKKFRTVSLFPDLSAQWEWRASFMPENCPSQQYARSGKAERKPRYLIARGKVSQGMFLKKSSFFFSLPIL